MTCRVQLEVGLGRGRQKNGLTRKGMHSLDFGAFRGCLSEVADILVGPQHITVKQDRVITVCGRTPQQQQNTRIEWVCGDTTIYMCVVYGKQT
jgi:hypothetical protein